MESVLEVLLVWVAASPVVGLLVGVAISRADSVASRAEGRSGQAPSLPDLSLIPAQVRAPAEVLQLRITQQP